MSDEDVFEVELNPFSAPARVVDVRPQLAQAAEDGVPPTYFGSADEWVRKFLLPSYRRRVTATDQNGGERWAAAWWGSIEALTRIEALWRMWEEVRTSPADLSGYWISHLDMHMKVLLSHTGPFAMSTDENRAGDMLPYTAPPTADVPPRRPGLRWSPHGQGPSPTPLSVVTECGTSLLESQLTALEPLQDDEPGMTLDRSRPLLELATSRSA